MRQHKLSNLEKVDQALDMLNEFAKTKLSSKPSDSNSGSLITMHSVVPASEDAVILTNVFCRRVDVNSDLYIKLTNLANNDPKLFDDLLHASLDKVSELLGSNSSEVRDTLEYWRNMPFADESPSITVALAFMLAYYDRIGFDPVRVLNTNPISYLLTPLLIHIAALDLIAANFSSMFPSDGWHYSPLHHDQDKFVTRIWEERIRYFENVEMTRSEMRAEWEYRLRDFLDDDDETDRPNELLQIHEKIIEEFMEDTSESSGDESYDKFRIHTYGYLALLRMLAKEQIVLVKGLARP